MASSSSNTSSSSSSSSTTSSASSSSSTTSAPSDGAATAASTALAGAPGANASSPAHALGGGGSPRNATAPRVPPAAVPADPALNFTTESTSTTPPRDDSRLVPSAPAEETNAHTAPVVPPAAVAADSALDVTADSTATLGASRRRSKPRSKQRSVPVIDYFPHADWNGTGVRAPTSAGVSASASHHAPPVLSDQQQFPDLGDDPPANPAPAHPRGGLGENSDPVMKPTEEGSSSSAAATSADTALKLDAPASTAPPAPGVPEIVDATLEQDASAASTTSSKPGVTMIADASAKTSAPTAVETSAHTAQESTEEGSSSSAPSTSPPRDDSTLVLSAPAEETNAQTAPKKDAPASSPSAVETSAHTAQEQSASTPSAADASTSASQQRGSSDLNLHAPPFNPSPAPGVMTSVPGAAPAASATPSAPGAVPNIFGVNGMPAVPLYSFSRWVWRPCWECGSPAEIVGSPCGHLVLCRPCYYNRFVCPCCGMFVIWRYCW